MKVKTSELTGAALDWAVAKCEGHDNWAGQNPLQWRDNNEREAVLCAYAPSTDWSQGGPIIERERIKLEHIGNRYGWTARWPTWVRCGDGETIPTEGGPTALVAAMRCYVNSKMGETAEVPEDLK